MSPEEKRAVRLCELTNMALAGHTLDKIRVRAYQMASKTVADQYVNEVLRRIQSIHERNNK